MNFLKEPLRDKFGFGGLSAKWSSAHNLPRPFLVLAQIAQLWMNLGICFELEAHLGHQNDQDHRI
jgi:hypothetical protein